MWKPDYSTYMGTFLKLQCLNNFYAVGLELRSLIFRGLAQTYSSMQCCCSRFLKTLNAKFVVKEHNWNAYCASGRLA